MENLLLLLLMVAAITLLAIYHMLVLWLLSRGLRLLPADAHWTEVARHYWPVRKRGGARIALTFFPALGFGYLTPTPLGPTVAFVCFFLVSYYLLAIVEAAFESRLIPRFSRSLGKILAEALLLNNPLTNFHLLLFVVSGIALFHKLQVGLLLTAALLCWTLVLQHGGLLAIWKWLCVSSPAEANFTEAVHALAPDLKPAVIEFRSHMMQALAFICSNAIGIAKPCFTGLTRSELLAVCRHELQHLRESPRQKFTKLLFSYNWLLLALAVSAYQQIGILGFYAMLGLFFVVNRMLLKTIRKDEFAADTQGKANSTEADADNKALGSALEKLHAYNFLPAVFANTKSLTHPNLIDRMAALGHEQTWPTPAPPTQPGGKLLGCFELGVLMVSTIIILKLRSELGS